MHQRTGLRPAATHAPGGSSDALSYYVALFSRRHFHPPAEIVTAAAVGLVFFQAPLLVFTAQAVRAVGAVGKRQTA